LKSVALFAASAAAFLMFAPAAANAGAALDAIK
jgi:hypothetical protein